MWKADITVGAAEYDLKTKSVTVLQCFGASCFFPSQFSSCLAAIPFLNLSAPFSRSNILLGFFCFLQSLSLCLSASICHSGMCSWTSSQPPLPFWEPDIQKYLVGRDAPGRHVGEELKFSSEDAWYFFSYCLFICWNKMSLAPAWRAHPDRYKSYPWPFQVWHSGFFSLGLLPLYWKQTFLFIFLSSLDQVFLKWLMSFADNSLQTGLLSLMPLQVPHTSRAPGRAWAKELLLPLLQFVGVSGSGGALLTWILTAFLLPAGLRAAWVLTALKSHLFCSFSSAAAWHICGAECLRGPTRGCALGGGFAE